MLHQYLCICTFVLMKELGLGVIWSLCMDFISLTVEFAYVPGCEVYNLGTGKGTSVLEMVAAFEKASAKVIFLFSCFLQLQVYFSIPPRVDKFFS